MAHVKKISAQQIADMDTRIFQGARLLNSVNAAAQAVLSEPSEAIDAPKARLAAMMSEQTNAPAVEEARARLKKFHAELTGGQQGELPKLFSKEQVHQYLSLISALQNPHDDFNREALREATRVLKLPQPFPREEVAAKLPALLESITPGRTR